MHRHTEREDERKWQQHKIQISKEMRDAFKSEVENKKQWHMNKALRWTIITEIIPRKTKVNERRGERERKRENKFTHKIVFRCTQSLVNLKMKCKRRKLICLSLLHTLPLSAARPFVTLRINTFLIELSHKFINLRVGDWVIQKFTHFYNTFCLSTDSYIKHRAESVICCFFPAFSKVVLKKAPCNMHMLSKRCKKKNWNGIKLPYVCLRDRHIIFEITSTEGEGDGDKQHRWRSQKQSTAAWLFINYFLFFFLSLHITFILSHFQCVNKTVCKMI